MKYKAKAKFNYFRLVNIGEELELSGVEYSRLSHIVEPVVEYSEPNFTDEVKKKPNKKYTKGIKK